MKEYLHNVLLIVFLFNKYYIHILFLGLLLLQGILLMFEVFFLVYLLC